MKIERTPKFNYLTSVKTQYEQHLIELLKEPFYMKYKELCDNTMKKTKNKNKLLKNFQDQLKNINEWDYETLKIHAKFIVHKSNCKYLPKLIKSVIISSTKNLIETSSRKKINIEYEIPNTMNFFKKCFNSISKSFYLEPTLLCDLNQKPGLRLKNINNSLELIRRAIQKAINSFLPYDEILDIYLNNVDDDSDNDSSDDNQSSDEEENDNEEEEYNDDYEDDEDDKVDENNLVEKISEENIKKEIIEEITDDVMNQLPDDDDNHSFINEEEHISQPPQPQPQPQLQPVQQPQPQLQPVQQPQPQLQPVQQPQQQLLQIQPQSQNGGDEQLIKITQDKDFPDEMNFLPMKSAPLPIEVTPAIDEIKQVSLKKSTQDDINFLRDLN